MLKKLTDDPVATANYLVQSFAISVERRVRAQDILSLERSAKNASTVKARQREESAALKALNRHFRDIERLVRESSR
jgi:hypothetical protein